MKRTAAIMAAAILAGAAAYANNFDIKSFRYAGPYTVKQPCMIDSVNVSGKKYEALDILDVHISSDALRSAAPTGTLPHCDSATLNLAGFSVETRDFLKTGLKIEGLRKFQLLIDGRKANAAKIRLEPGTHDFTVKFQGPADSIKMSLTGIEDGQLRLREDNGRIFSLDLNTQGAACGGISLSPEGKYLVVKHSTTHADGKRSMYSELKRLSDGRTIFRTADRLEWMPGRDLLIYARKTVSGRDLITADPETGEETMLAAGIPEGNFKVCPGGRRIICFTSQEGPKEGPVHQILVPDDRQPGWRKRSGLAVYDIASGQMQDLTFGFHNAWLNDISADGTSILFSTSRERLEKRPTTLNSLYLMDLGTLETKCIVKDDGFIGSATFSPDGRKIAVKGSAESFGGLGLNLPEGRIPNAYDMQLYIIDLDKCDGEGQGVTALTRDFNPSVEDFCWNAYDNRIYFTAQDKDCIGLFRADPSSLRFESLAGKEDNIAAFGTSDTSPVIAYYGQSLGNWHKVYTVDGRTGTQRLIHDFNSERLADVELGEGHAYEFTSSRGDLINCFYVLPPDFDGSRKYPMIVHYYGGCSPTSRYCVGSYSPQLYAAQGYVFLAVNPSGASGFGQEFASRHVNTAGDGVAEDIIEAVKSFCTDNGYVDSSRIGCFSASYGGFMTQLLLEKTDIFATGISHAGISSHTSYWGEGYWGYSYSEVSMADSYPWTRKDLYVDRSPLYNADRIHTPLLFLHGSADTNVPIGESIQMFTALKLLGQDTAFVVVDGENHGISDYEKRRQWLRTISAWFAKYLKDDSSWWDELYPAKNL